MSDYVFLYWDDPGDSQEHVDKQHESESCPQYQRDADEELELEAERRMMIILRNGNEGLHYDIYDDGEEEDIEAVNNH